MTSVDSKWPKIRRLAGGLLQHPVVATLVSAAILAVIALTAHSFQGGDDPRFPVSGPSQRTVFNCTKPAPCLGTEFVTFNANVGNPGYGDERNFLLVKRCENKREGGFRDTVTVEPGDCILFRIIVDNAASEAVALGTRVAITPNDAPAVNAFVRGWVCAENARPKCIWDEVRLDSVNGDPLRAVYENESARVISNSHPNPGKPINDFLDSSGALVSAETPMDGRVYPAYEGSLIVTGNLAILGDR